MFFKLQKKKVCRHCTGGLDASIATTVIGGVGALAGAATEAYAVSHNDKTAEAIGAGEMGLGTAAAVGGGIGINYLRPHWVKG